MMTTNNLIPFVSTIMDEFSDSFGSNFLLEENNLKLKVNVAGIDKDDLSVSYDSVRSILKIKKKDKIIKSYRIPKSDLIDPDNSKVSYNKGMLIVEIPRNSDEKEFKIK